ncbi:hypothetical protein ACFWZW_12165 [Microbacterium enclense]|uniref:hypothetical protein n=1 Tax=Microbacterium enclense TaxID=993073 RepID=UPI0036DDB89C
MPRGDLAEAIAWWRLGTADGRRVLVDAAVDAVVNGAAGAAVVELAGLFEVDSASTVDALVERVIAEEELDDRLGPRTTVLAVQRLCRATLRGETSERELVRWTHDTVGHTSDDELIDRLADLDDEFDRAEVTTGEVATVIARIRATAKAVLARSER